ncbi:hypothetical protein HKX48_003289, partial [Thoreauomyces humboldtii]
MQHQQQQQQQHPRQQAPASVAAGAKAPGPPAPQPGVTLTITDFYLAFVNPRLHPSLPYNHMQHLCMEYLGTARMSPQDIWIPNDVSSVSLTARGVRVLQNLNVMRHRTWAAISIQSVWRGRAARRFVRSLKKGKQPAPPSPPTAYDEETEEARAVDEIDQEYLRRQNTGPSGVGNYAKSVTSESSPPRLPKLQIGEPFEISPRTAPEAPFFPHPQQEK